MHFARSSRGEQILRQNAEKAIQEKREELQRKEDKRMEELAGLSVKITALGGVESQAGGQETGCHWKRGEG